MMRVMVVRPCWIRGARAVPGSSIELPDELAREMVQLRKVVIAPEIAVAPEGETRVVRPKRKTKARTPGVNNK